MTHAHDLPLLSLRVAQRRALSWALALNVAFVGIELAGGVAFHSLALLADSAHQVTDVVALVVAVAAVGLAARPGSARHTFGLQRAEVLAAAANGCLLVAASVVIVVEAVHRIQHPGTVRAGGVAVVAGLGLLANGAGAVLLARVRGASLNVAGAALHLATDAVALLGTIIGAVVVLATGASRADPIVSLAIAALAALAAWKLLGATVHVLLEGTPSGLDPPSVEAALLSADDVAGVHHVHVWSLASDVTALSAHVVLAHQFTLHEAQERAGALKAMLADRFGIEHATIELECHECDVPDDTGRLPSRR
jgi:cobalt-zinc-cadmium efflux system protein